MSDRSHEELTIAQRLKQFAANTPVWAPEDRKVLADSAARITELEAQLAVLAEFVREQQRLQRLLDDINSDEEPEDWLTRYQAASRAADAVVAAIDAGKEPR